LVVYASSNDDKISSEDADAANPIMQELLVDILKIETGKENLNQYVEDESDKLRLFVEEVRRRRRACTKLLVKLLLINYTTP
jgi:hypothetical protein